MKTISKETIDFFTDAVKKSKNISEIVANPKKHIDKSVISQNIVDDINAIKQQKKHVFKESDEILEQEIVSFVNAVLIRGGQYLNAWHEEPSKTAKKLGFRLSAEAETAIKNFGFTDIASTLKYSYKGKDGIAPAIAIVIIIVIVLIPSNTKQKETLVIDYSGKTKI